MDNRFFEKPILNSPYEYPARHWELDTPIPKPRKRKPSADQGKLVFDEGAGLSTAGQEYDPTPVINELRHRVSQWRGLTANRASAAGSLRTEENA